MLAAADAIAIFLDHSDSPFSIEKSIGIDVFELLSRPKKMNQNTHSTSLTRRTILGGAVALATHAILPRINFGADAAKPNSVFGGVRIGCITYSYRGGPDTA